MSNIVNLFIDESGKPDLLDKKYKNFILTGITIPNIELDIASGYFSFIKRKYALPENIPFHTYDLLENPNSEYLFTEIQSNMFVRSMIEFLELVQFKIVIIRTNKPTFIKKYRIKEEMLKGSQENKKRNGIIYLLSSLTVFEKFALDLENGDKNGTIHADSRKYLDNQLLKAFIDIKEPMLKGKNPNSSAVAVKRLCSIEFADKTALSSGLELADFISYVAFAKLERKLARFHLQRVWKLIKSKLEDGNFITLKDMLVRSNL